MKQKQNLDITYLEPSDDEQSIDVMDLHLLGNFIQMFAWKRSST